RGEPKLRIERFELRLADEFDAIDTLESIQHCVDDHASNALASAVAGDDDVEEDCDKHAVGQRSGETDELVVFSVDRANDHVRAGKHRLDIVPRSASAPPLTVEQVQELTTVRVTEG